MRKLLMIPGPTNVPDRVMQAMLTPVINHRGEEFHELYRRIQTNAQKVFETKNEIVVISGSGTAGVDAAVDCILQSGETAVVPSFGEFSGRLGDSARYTGAKVVSPQSELGSVPTLEEVDAAMGSGGKVKALCVVLNETSTGITWRKLRELKELASAHGALFVVDAISCLGGESLPVDKLGIDICITGSQKCLAAPPGLVILSFSEEAKRAMSEIKPRTQYFDIPKYFKFAEHGETPSTPAIPLFFALDESLKMVLEEQLENRIKRHTSCAEAFYDAFEYMGLKAFALSREFRSHTVIGIMYPPGIDDKMFRTTLDEKFGVVVAGGFGKLKGSMFRVGSMGEINEASVISTISGVAQTMSLLGYRCDATEAISVASRKFREEKE
ncbi:MAG TPA: alanine--glyoxylate aminotransferase family protein [Nitrososphaerales archaeon]|nr:alanine--glyoxylate aminotransferase family protein [Nitrososphaerales archaeon]